MSDSTWRRKSDGRLEMPSDAKALVWLLIFSAVGLALAVLGEVIL